MARIVLLLLCFGFLPKWSVCQAAFGPIKSYRTQGKKVFRYPIAKLCEKKIGASSPLNQRLSASEIDCMGTVLGQDQLYDFCRKQTEILSSGQALSLAIVKKNELLCQTARAVYFQSTMGLPKKHPQKICEELATFLAADLVLDDYKTHKTKKGSKDVLSCSYRSL